MLSKKEKRRYAMAMKCLEYGYLGYRPSLFRSLTLTTREGDDNSEITFKKHLRELVDGFRREGYEIEYCGALSYTPSKRLLHWHGLWRIKGGYFLCSLKLTKFDALKEVRKRWLGIHNAFEVDFDVVHSQRRLREYISKHILKGYAPERIRLNVSRGWRRKGVKDVAEKAMYFASKGKSRIWMTKEDWEMVNDIVSAWCSGEAHMWKRGSWSIFVHDFEVQFNGG